jgi:hypothetical protein
MGDKLKLFGFLLLSAIGLMLGAGMLGGIIGYDKGKAACGTIVETDTVVETHVVYVPSPPDTVYKKIKVPFPVAVHDTTVDSVLVELPMEWHLASVPDTADVWYHGIMAAVDSMRFYTHNTIVTNNIVKTEYKMPRLTLDAGAGAMYHDGGIAPYLVGEVRMNMPKTAFSTFGAIDYQGRWVAGLNLTYRINLIK